jgi:hypothetical protein
MVHVSMIVEMRTYKLKPDIRARFLDIFLTRSIPEHRYEGPLWKQELENVLMPMIARYVVVVDDSDHPIRW